MKSKRNITANGRNWRRQIRDRITDPDALADHLGIPPRQRAHLMQIATRYPIAVTPYYLALIRPDDPADPIRRQCIPAIEELTPTSHDHPDPFRENGHPAGLIHRYANRAVFLAHNDCAVRCRHCTRKNDRFCATGQSWQRLDTAVKLVRAKPQIQEIILSGGDPFLLETVDLSRIIDAFRSIPHVAVIRIGTRVPVTLPMRIDRELCRMLGQRRPLWINTHFNHPREITPEAAAACDRLQRCGIPVSNQTVLLRGVNDQFDILKTLCERLFAIMVHPYYLFDADPVSGTAHFRVTRRRGRELHRRLSQALSGLALPRYAADVPDWPHKRILA